MARKIIIVHFVNASWSKRTDARRSQAWRALNFILDSILTSSHLLENPIIRTMRVIALVLLVIASASALTVSGVAKAAVTNSFLPNVNVSLTAGGVLQGSTMTSAQGVWTFTGVAASQPLSVNYQIAGYSSLTVTGAIGLSDIQSPSTLDGSLSAQFTPGSTALRAVLSWGSTPMDLDLFLVSSCGVCRVWRDNKTCVLGGLAM